MRGKTENRLSYCPLGAHIGPVSSQAPLLPWICCCRRSAAVQQQSKLNPVDAAVKIGKKPCWAQCDTANSKCVMTFVSSHFILRGQTRLSSAAAVLLVEPTRPPEIGTGLDGISTRANWSASCSRKQSCQQHPELFYCLWAKLQTRYIAISLQASTCGLVQPGYNCCITAIAARSSYIIHTQSMLDPTHIRTLTPPRWTTRRTDPVADATVPGPT